MGVEEAIIKVQEVILAVLADEEIMVVVLELYLPQLKVMSEEQEQVLLMGIQAEVEAVLAVLVLQVHPKRVVMVD